MPLLVTSAFGVNGDGYGALCLPSIAMARRGARSVMILASPTRKVWPCINVRDCCTSTAAKIGSWAVGADGTVVRDTGPIEELNPGGGISGQMAGITSGCEARAQSWRLSHHVTQLASISSQRQLCRFPAGLRSVTTED
jgi:hypothetical protein